MNEQFATVGEIELCYETFGDPADPALLLIMGLGTQMVGWHEEFCGQLAERGFFVIRFDNRDVGRSTHFDDAAAARRSAAAAPAIEAPAPTRSPTWPTTPPACSTTSGIDKAHVVGASMGGMIAQLLASRHPGARAVAGLDHVEHRATAESASPRCACCPALLRRAAAATATPTSSAIVELSRDRLAGLRARRGRRARAARR